MPKASCMITFILAVLILYRWVGLLPLVKYFAGHYHPMIVCNNYNKILFAVKSARNITNMFRKPGPKPNRYMSIILDGRNADKYCCYCNSLSPWRQSVNSLCSSHPFSAYSHNRHNPITMLCIVTLRLINLKVNNVCFHSQVWDQSKTVLAQFPQRKQGRVLLENWKCTCREP